MLQAVCPNEIATFKAAVDAKFREPVLELSAATDDAQTPIESPPVAPAPETPDEATTIETSAVTIEDSDPTATLLVEPTTVDTDNTTNSNGNGNGHHLLSYDDLKKCDRHNLTKLAKQHGIEGKTKKDDLAKALTGMISESEMEAATGSNGRV